MHEISYKVTLLSDVVVSSDSATVGGHRGEDHLRGSLFLGATAARMGRGFSAELLLSGKVRFLNAYPMIDGQPSLPIPLSFHKIKGEDWQNKTPLNLIETTEPPTGKQPQQWRRGYMTTSGLVDEVTLSTRMKTAVDRQRRTSKEGQLFGYQAISAGQSFLLTIQADSEEDLLHVSDLLAQEELFLGRSRFAEYGATRLEPVTDHQLHKNPVAKGNEVILYLASDLALTQAGMVTLKPDPQHFGITEGQYLAEKSYVRLRRYTPWNSFFNCRMEERNVLCKGSVLVFSTKTQPDLPALQQKLASGVGLYTEEGLGQILVNPPWLIQAPKLRQAATPAHHDAPAPKTVLTAYLKRTTAQRQLAEETLQIGRKWAEKWHHHTKALANDGQETPSKSQWSAIRQVAMQSMTEPSELTKNLENFCCQGLRSQTWTEASVKHGGKNISLFDLMKDALTEFPGEKGRASLYQAAIEMGRIMDRSEAEKEG